MKQATAIDRINNEYEYACKHFKPFTNKYNGYAVILQELDDLWLAIKEDHESYTKVAAMALRFLTDYCE
jgi:hypothetical protein